MDSNEKALARTIFIRKVHESDGQAFEDLFTTIMTRANANFTPIKPQGNIGDRKNDGYDPTQGRYYQVFAPEDINKSKSAAVKKVKDDFSGLKKYWDKICPIKEFYFVFNDKYKGSFPTIEEDLKSIKDEHNLDNAGVFISKHLEDHLFALPEDQIITIIGYIPDPSKIVLLDYSALNEVIGHILKNKKKIELDSILNVPDFNEKIEFNGLSSNTGALLKTGSFHIGLLEVYFAKNSTFIKQEVRDALNEIYLEALTKDFEDNEGIVKADLVFFDILYNATPHCADESLEGVQNATLVLMSYYFESCDIFEEPI